SAGFPPSRTGVIDISIRMSCADSPAKHPGRLHRYGPVLLGASMFACTDVLVKVALMAGAGVLTMAAVRGVLGLVLLGAWLQVGPCAQPLATRARWISLGLGVLFAGNVYLLFKAIEAVEVPVAILTYFAYPLLTGLAGAASGL